jgi:hypothetical protein
MKAKKLAKKLSLNKSTIARLNINDLSRFKGGAAETYNDPCPSDGPFCTLATRCVACNTDYPCLTVDLECI